MKKRIISILLAAAVVLSVSGCGEKGKQSSSDENGKKQVDITWSVYKGQDENWIKSCEAVVENYNEQNQNGVNVSLNFVEATDDAQYNTWLSSQLMGGAASEINMTWYTPAVENYRKGLIIDLTEYLEQQNPYSDSEGAWKDQYTEGILNQGMDNLSNAIPSIPLNTVAVKVFYNKDLFEKAGITEIPETFDQFMEMCNQMQEKGIVPFIAANKSPADNIFNWLHRMFMDQMIDGFVHEMDMSGNAQIELNEICAAYDQGKINLTEEPWSAPLEIIKDFSAYWYPGYNGLDTNSARDLFLRQEGAMFMSTGDTFKLILDNPDISFDVGYFTFPYLTKETTPFACEVSYEMGGAPQNSQCIPSTVEGEKLDAAVDFLQYLGSEKGASVFAEIGWKVPPFKEVSDMPEVLSDMYISGKTSVLRLLAPQTDQLLYQDDTKLAQLYLDNQITAEEFNETLQKDLSQSVEQLKATNNWNEENGWGTE